jgi:DNA-binding SARP family transcriptional activator
MQTLSCRLLGRFEARHDDQPISQLRSAKAQELFCWLLLNGNRPHHREVVASRLWGEVPTRLSRKYLRQALWQLQTALRVPNDDKSEPIVVVDTDWIRLSTDRAPGLWVDVFEFQKAFDQTHSVASPELTTNLVETARGAVNLYNGDLLEGWYQDWCQEERERLRAMYLVLLDKLGTYWESRSRPDLATEYARRILDLDRADERAHRRLMRIQCLAGDRRAALRQYQLCREALADELGVQPSQSTETLYRIIATIGESNTATLGPSFEQPGPDWIPQVLEQLEQLRTSLGSLQARILSHAIMNGEGSYDIRGARDFRNPRRRAKSGKPFPT